MGCIYRPTYTVALRDGTRETRTGKRWFIKYRNALGHLVREPSGTTDEREAKKLLRRREGAADDGRLVRPQAEKVTIRELADDLKAEYQANGRRSLPALKARLAHLLPVFGDRRAIGLTTDAATAYVTQRQAAEAANASINRELAALRRMFTLALEAERIHRAPKIRPLQEDNIRSGFFEREQFEAVRRHLPEPLRPVATIAYITGWRVRSELLTLTWAQVDLKAGTLRLEPGTTKNREGRTVYMTPELRATLEAQRALTDSEQRILGAIIPWVFHRYGGKPIRNFMHAWHSACRAAGCPGRIPHDFRRTAVRNLERAGVSRSAAMKMVGHKTENVYRRYAIVSAADLMAASAKLAQLEAVQDSGKNAPVAIAGARRIS